MKKNTNTQHESRIHQHLPPHHHATTCKTCSPKSKKCRKKAKTPTTKPIEQVEKVRTNRINCGGRWKRGGGGRGGVGCVVGCVGRGCVGCVGIVKEKKQVVEGITVVEPNLKLGGNGGQCQHPPEGGRGNQEQFIRGPQKCPE